MTEALFSTSFPGWDPSYGPILNKFVKIDVNDPNPQEILPATQGTRYRVWGVIVKLRSTSLTAPEPLTNVVSGSIGVGPNYIKLHEIVISQETFDSYNIEGSIRLNNGWGVQFTPSPLPYSLDLEFTVSIEYTID